MNSLHPSRRDSFSLDGTEVVEIARVRLASAMLDEVSVRARRVRGGIAYSIRDDYGTAFDVYPACSRKPLTMRAITRLMDSATDEGGIVYGYVKFNAQDRVGSVDDLRTFATVSSPFYPDLGRWYALWMNHYLDTLKAGEGA